MMMLMPLKSKMLRITDILRICLIFIDFRWRRNSQNMGRAATLSRHIEILIHFRVIHCRQSLFSCFITPPLFVIRRRHYVVTIITLMRRYWLFSFSFATVNAISSIPTRIAFSLRRHAVTELHAVATLSPVYAAASQFISPLLRH